jgi:hypothetical protein
VTRPRLEGKSCDAAQGMLAAIEFMHMKMRQRVVKAGKVDRTAAEQFYALAASSPTDKGDDIFTQRL